MGPLLIRVIWSPRKEAHGPASIEQQAGLTFEAGVYAASRLHWLGLLGSGVPYLITFIWYLFL